MKKKFKIIRIVMLIIFVLFVFVTVKYFYLNKEGNIREYFNIQLPSKCEFISYKKTLEELKAIVKVNESEMRKMQEDIEKHYGKAGDVLSRGICYSVFEEDFGMEKNKIIEMYEGLTSRTRWYVTIKTVSMYVFFVKGEEGEYYICFDTELWSY